MLEAPHAPKGPPPMQISLTAADGHTFSANRADPPAGTKPRGAIVVIQEIFGVNSHMRRTTDGFAADGYVAICPALFDRLGQGIELGYTPDDVAKGRELRGRIAWEAVLADMAAAKGGIGPILKFDRLQLAIAADIGPCKFALKSGFQFRARQNEIGVGVEAHEQHHVS